jgi:hypothetical protein
MAETTTISPAGRLVKPSACASGENGSATPMETTTRVERSSGTLGLLRRNGTRRVRIATMARLCV